MEWLVFIAVLAIGAGLSVAVITLLDWLFGWFGDLGPMYGGGRRHRRHLARLARRAAADYDFCSALASLTAADREWLESTGWEEPRHASFVRLNDWKP